MHRCFTFVFLIVTLVSASAPMGVAQSDTPAGTVVQPGDSVDLDSLVWVKRPLVVFADNPNDPRYIQQMRFINDQLDALAERDVLVLTDTNKAEGSALRDRLHPRGFVIVLLSKDGTIYLRKPVPWDVREISRVIDKLPLRQQEIRDRRASRNGG